jgi:hypothetical protein
MNLLLRLADSGGTRICMWLRMRMFVMKPRGRHQNLTQSVRGAQGLC